ncbi:MAG TPA: class I SAM-dependent methyltransferase [Burkholderiales bacterium]
MTAPLHLGPADFETLLQRLGPSLGVWRAAEVAVLRTQRYVHPVLDLGCGDGIVASLVLPRIDIGVDPSREALVRAARLGCYVRLEPVAIEDLALAPESVGTIMSNSVLEHVADLPLVLRTAARLLRPRGRLIFTSPTEAFSAWLALPSSRYAAWRNAHYEHRNLWTVPQWAHHLRQAGLQIVSVRPYLRRGLVTVWDALELAQRVWIGRRRLFSLLWRRVPPQQLARLARRLARLDLSAPHPGGGRLIVAEKM